MSVTSPVAVVVGICGHGLAITRALHRSSIKVEVLEANPALPGVHTRCANIHMVADINSMGLIDSLLALAEEMKSDVLPVLILTNDHMVEIVGDQIERLRGYFALSWSDSYQDVLRLLKKDQLAARCYVSGLNYPRTVLINTVNQADSRIGDLRYPIIIKPTRPLSSFKTLILRSADDFPKYYDQVAVSLPVIAQEFVLGDDCTIRFGALYLDQGRVLAHFEGRKLRSRPMGHTTLAVSEPHDEIYQLTVRFFEGLALSGPVSLELKQAPDNSFWVIEPTVGRTDFWVGLCIANGVNLPLIEYASQAGLPLPEVQQLQDCLWINGERDPFVLFWLMLQAPRFFLQRRIVGLYFDVGDIVPFLNALLSRMRFFISRIFRMFIRRVL